ncbi:hypothetical protein [Altererythrobacter ishigakiensis]|uniref:5-bromo-4-chloroindolyl phosphate hydrolysis protein n=1 Tax=Altererythrobacter ishigakiensis TaxID=476157 RepID=A0A562UUP6_9SPHN|nr:hypothetical protein [Altererythrobacter ishigakiensis]TWJ09297.1 hypothetical protein JN10_0927 [Altererythrobacter ishigakiensis]
MSDSTRESDAILSAAGKSLVANRDHGGTHRSAESIGRFSAEAKSKHWKKMIKRILIAFAGIWAAAVAIGLIIDGIGFTGIMLTVLAAMVAVGVIARGRKLKIPQRHELKKGDAKQMVASTELWLEAQRPALPAPAVQLVDKLGVQLDALGMQLQTIDQADPAVNEVRELVGEYIPETIDNYRKIPQHLRQETHAGKTADERLTDSLTKLSGEVDRVTRRLAEGALDDLAIKDRYLEYRYGGPEALEDQSK